MNDHELDEMLDQWNAPPMRDELREELRTRFIAMPRQVARVGRMRRILDAMPGMRIGRIAVAGIAAAVLVFAIIQVFPKTVRMASPDFRIPFYVEFEFARYADGHSTPHESWITAFPYAGHEIVMSVRESGNSFLNTFRSIANSFRNQVILLAPSLVLPKEPPMAEPAWFAGFVSSGCSNGRNVVGHEIIAGHAATVVQNESSGRRTTVWMAPDLACFALKLTFEVQEPDGTYRMQIRKEAVKVTMNP